MVRFFSLILSFAFAINTNAQTAKVTLEDGSVIRCQIVASTLAIDTSYGPLVIPVSDITKIKFGLHATPTEAKEISDANRRLKSEIYKEREIAKKTFLSMGRLGVPMLTRATKIPDTDLSKNADLLLQSITDNDPRAKEISEFDSIQTLSFPITGKIKAESMAFRSATLGEFTVPLGKIESLTLLAKGDASFAINAKTHGADWLASGIVLDSGDVLTVKAFGTVELWPQGPGQYISPSPKGYNTAGKGGQFLAGALIGKVGNGSPFPIGEQAMLTTKETGELFLQIVQSPWNNASEGSYNVSIKVTR